jgi:hypothetical protein
MLPVADHVPGSAVGSLVIPVGVVAIAVFFIEIEVKVAAVVIAVFTGVFVAGAPDFGF